MKPRPYQISLFERAKNANSIVYLETGTGKTMISILLMDFVLGTTASKIVFLAPTNALVHQQTASIEEFLDFEIAGYSFEPFMLSKSRDFWLEEWNRNEIMVMTPQLLVNLLQHGYIQISMIDLLIIDECHKSAGMQPLAVLMKQYYHTSAKKPQVFGMTASPLYQGKISVEKARNSLVELQQTLDSQLIAVTDPSMVSEFVQNAVEHMVDYSSYTLSDSECFERYQTFRGYLIDHLYSIVKRKGPLEESELRLLVKHHLDSLEPKERTGLATLEKQIFGLEHILQEYGTLAAFLYARKLYHSLYGNKRKVWDDFEISKDDVSPKVLVLLRLLENYLDVEQGKQCIVFVDRRDCVESLCELLNHLAGEHNLSFHCGFAVGKTNTLSKTLELFKKGKINVLVSTRVTAEGIDMPNCQLVIIADPFRSNSDYIQTRGRARDSNPRYIMMLKHGDKKAMKCYSNAKLAEGITKQLLNEMTMDHQLIQIQHNSSDEVWDQVLQGKYDIPLDTATGASLFPTGSIPVLSRYLQSIGDSPRIMYEQEWPGNAWTDVHPKILESIPKRSTEHQFWLQNNSEPSYGFLYSVTISIANKLTKLYGSLRMTKKLAQKHACFIACGILHSKALLDDHMMPSKPKSLPVFDPENQFLIPRRVPSIFAKKPLSRVYVTVIEFNVEGLEQKHKFSNEDMIGICTFARFQHEHFELPDMFVNGKYPAQIGFREGGWVELDFKQLERLQQYQTEVWNLVLASRKETESVHVKTDHHYLIVPFSKTPWQIDWNHIDMLLGEKSHLMKHWSTWEDKLDDLIIQTVHNGHFYQHIQDSFVIPTDSFSKVKKGKKVKVTYQDYFTEIGYTIDESLPMLSVQRSSPIQNCFAFEEVQDPNQDIYIPRDISILYPISYYFLSLLKTIPSIVYVMETHGLVQDFFDTHEKMDYKVMEQCMYSISCEMPWNYERLETLGDAVLKLAVGLDLYGKYSSELEAQLSRERSQIVSNSNLQRIAEEKGYTTLIQTNPFVPHHFNPPIDSCKTEPLERELKPKKHADFLEAVCGGYFFTRGFPCAWRFLQRCGLVDDYKPIECDVKLSVDQSILFSEQVLFGHAITSKSIFCQALSHPSISNQHYERLEFVGDAILDLLILKYYFDTFPSANPGQLSNLKSITVSNDILSYLCYAKGLFKYIQSDAIQQQLIQEYIDYAATLTSPLDDKEHEPPKIMADVFEAIVASIYIDSNCDLSYTWSCILPIFKPVFDLLSPNQQLTNPTRLFRERVKQLGIDYNEISYDFVEGNELVLCNVFVRGQQVGSGQGNSRKYAKRRASQFGTEWLLSHSHLLFDKESEGYL